MLQTTRQFHRWLMLIVGVQFLIWSASGLYMVFADIHYIHGEGYLKPESTLLGKPVDVIGFDELLLDYPGAQNITLGVLEKQPVYRFSHNGDRMLVSASSGEKIPNLSAQQAVDVAQLRLAEPLPVKQVSWLAERNVWQVEFSELGTPTINVNRVDGRVEYVRHTPWYVFDILWRLHIMDYTEGEDTANLLLVTVTIIGLTAALSGLLLLFLRLFGKDTVSLTP